MTTWLNTPIQMQFRVIDGLTIRFAQSEDRDDHAQLLSPWPESLLAFEPMWARLAEHAHLVAIDLPGFGHSQRRDALLSPRAMGEFLITAADAFGLASPHIVGPDIGTAAALRDLLPQIQTAVQIIAGARDQAVPPVNAEFLHHRLPHSKLDILDAGHFTWEDAADEYAALVTTWWTGGYQAASS